MEQKERVELYEKDRIHSKRLGAQEYITLGQSIVDVAGLGLKKKPEELAVFDVGCSVGETLKNLTGVPRSTMAGCDISKTALTYAEENIPGAELFRVDLDDPESCGMFWKYWDDDSYTRHANVVNCLEVAEHVQYSMDLCYTISRIAYPKDSILFFSGAKPGQRGHGHINCQEAQYWIDRLSVFGWTMSSRLTRRFKGKIVNDCSKCYVENTRVYVR